MSSENNKPMDDRLESAIAAMKNVTAANDQPPAALVAATIETLRRLDTAGETGAGVELQSPDADLQRQAAPAVEPRAIGSARPTLSRFRRPILWGGALAAALLIAIVVHWPKTPVPSSEVRRVDSIVITEVNPAVSLERLDNELAHAQAETTALIDDAKKRLAEEQITRILADDSKLVAPSQAN
jgi:hypothetical protein